MNASTRAHGKGEALTAGAIGEGECSTAEVLAACTNTPRTKVPTTETTDIEQNTRQRVQLDFTPEAFGRLQEIKTMADVKTNAEVVRNAIRLYEWFLRQQRENYRFQLVRDDTIREVEIIL